MQEASVADMSGRAMRCAKRQSVETENARGVRFRPRNNATVMRAVGRGRQSCVIEGDAAGRRCSDGRDAAASGGGTVRRGVGRLLIVLLRRVLLARRTLCGISVGLHAGRRLARWTRGPSRHRWCQQHAAEQQHYNQRLRNEPSHVEHSNIGGLRAQPHIDPNLNFAIWCRL